MSAIHRENLCVYNCMWIRVRISADTFATNTGNKSALMCECVKWKRRYGPAYRHTYAHACLWEHARFRSTVNSKQLFNTYNNNKCNTLICAAHSSGNHKSLENGCRIENVSLRPIPSIYECVWKAGNRPNARDWQCYCSTCEMNMLSFIVIVMNEWTNVKCVFYECRRVVSLYEFRTNSTHPRY